MNSKDAMAQIFNSVPKKVQKVQNCRKRKFASRVEAVATLLYVRNVRRNRRGDGDSNPEKRVYPCPECKGFWHLSSH